MIISFFCLDQQVQYQVVEDYNGACCPLNKGIQTFFRTPCTEEPRIPLVKGDIILATRGTKYVYMHRNKNPIEVLYLNFWVLILFIIVVTSCFVDGGCMETKF